MRQWMLIVNYNLGLFKEEIIERRIYGWESKAEVYKEKASILKKGFIDNSYRQNDFTDPDDKYEHWVAPSQVIGFDIMEYEVVEDESNTNSIPR